MRNRRFYCSPKQVLCRIFYIALIAPLITSCSSNTNIDFKPTDGTVAHFDYFSYTGMDDFYNENPLTDNNSFYNPVLPGWYSDPSICRNGEDYFLVTSTFSYFPGVPIFHSKDLVNWKQIGHILNRESQLPLEGQHTSGGIFAPAISYNPMNQTYYMITTNVGMGNFFVKAKDPFGSWSEPIYLPDVHGIDPSFFFDDNGKAFIVNNDAPEGTPLYDGHRAIWVQEFDVATDRTVGPRKVLINGGIHFEDKPIWIEGPHMYKINGQYYLMAAEGGTGPNHSEVILKGDSPMGEFKAWRKNPILTQRHLDAGRENPVTCAGHADLVQTTEGDWWAVFLACRPINGDFENLGRETFLMPVKWSIDGFPYITRDNDLVPMVVNKSGVERQAKVTFGNFEYKDDFDSEKLFDGWITLRSSAKELYSVSDNPGFLSLKCTNKSASETGTPAYVGRRIQHHKFECTTTVYFNPKNESEYAGLLLYKNESHQYFLSVSKSATARKVNIHKISESGSEVMASAEVDNDNPIELKIISTGTHFDFLFKNDKRDFKILLDNVDAKFLSTANAGGFTGTTIGLYASSKIK